jgi:hypothetical protein
MTNATAIADQAAAPPPCRTDRSRRRWIAPASVAALAVMVGVLVWYSATHALYDFTIYMWGGRSVSHDTRLYTELAGANWFTYSPFAATVFAPVAVIPAAVARVIWQLASVAALAWSCVLTFRLAGWRVRWPAIAAAVAIGLTLEPIYHTLYLGQINLILMALVLGDVWLIARGRPAGVGVGIAAAIKLTPAIFIVLFLLTRRTRSALIAMATFAVCTLSAWVIAPGASRMYWLHVFYDTRRLGVPYISNQSVYAAVVRIAGGVSHVGPWEYVLPLAIGSFGLIVAAVLARHRDWLGAVAATSTTGLLVSPISWTHHWVWVLPALVVLLRGGTGARLAAAVGYVLFVAAPMWFTPHAGGPSEYGFHGVITVIANCFMLAGLAFLAYLGRQAWRSSRATAQLKAMVGPMPDPEAAPVPMQEPGRGLRQGTR